MLLAAPTALAADEAQVRFVHAVPGASEAAFSVSGTDAGGAGFGEATGMTSVPSGKVKLSLDTGDGGPVNAAQRLEPGTGYTVVAMPVDEGVEMRAFENGSAKAGAAKVRIIHAAPELGEPDVMVGDKALASGATYTDASSYATFQPGRYKLTAQNPEDGSNVMPPMEVPLAAGSSETAVVVGSRGERAEMVLVDDGNAAPSTGPETGFGGLSDGGTPAWLLALLAAMGAGAIGGMLHRLATARPGSAGPRGEG